MIFVTVGTHEQPFDRLIRTIDKMKADGIITEEVIVQTGYSTYIPTHCTHAAMFPHAKMKRLVRDARIVITHGGPSSFLMPIQMSKVPIVVPRMHRFGEHVNDHQIEFCRTFAARYKNILVAENEAALQDAITSYSTVTEALSAEAVCNNAAFNEGLQRIISSLFAKTEECNS